MSTRGARKWTVWRCPVEDCRNLHLHGADFPGERYEDSTPWCHGKNAKGRPDSHEPVAFEPIQAIDSSAIEGEIAKWRAEAKANRRIARGKPSARHQYATACENCAASLQALLSDPETETAKPDEVGG